MPGRIATLIQNLSNFEWPVRSEVLTLEMERLSDPDVFAIEPGLLQAKSLARKLVPLAAEIWHTWEMSAAATMPESSMACVPMVIWYT